MLDVSETQYSIFVAHILRSNVCLLKANSQLTIIKFSRSKHGLWYPLRSACICSPCGVPSQYIVLTSCGAMAFEKLPVRMSGQCSGIFHCVVVGIVTEHIATGYQLYR